MTSGNVADATTVSSSPRPALAEALSNRTNTAVAGRCAPKTPSLEQQIAMSPPPPPRPHPSPRATVPSSVNGQGPSAMPSKTKEPNLYDSIFGPGSGLDLAQARKAASNASSSAAASASTASMTNHMPSTPTRGTSKPRSPHVHTGSSARLHAMASMPQLGSPGRSGKDSRDPHNDPVPSHQQRAWENHSVSFAAPIGSPSRRKMQESTHVRGSSGAGFWPSSPARSRQRSAGDSLLPNGHPASSLAQDLGIARPAEELSRPTTPSSGATRPLTPSWRSTRRNNDSHFRFENSSSSEAAAHSLLDLAASPSPSPSGPASCARFAGHTPSLQGFAKKPSRATVQYKLFDDIDDQAGDASRDNETGNHYGAEISLPNSQSSVSSDASEVSALSALQPAPALTSDYRSYNIKREEQDDEGVRTPLLLKSPPMTSPRTESKQRFVTDTSLHAPSTPSSSKRARNLVLVDELQEPAFPRTRMQSRDQHLSTAADERPTTPPKQTPSSTPSTPKAPGSNFRYGDFLHVSPSPQPRSRTSSAMGGASARQLGLAGVQDTPTRGSKAVAKFLDFGHSSHDEDDEAGDDLFVLAAKKRSGSPSLHTGVKRSRQVSSSMI